MASTVTSRGLVLEILLKITRDGEYSHIVLKNVLDQYQYLDKKERAFITRVVDGTLERMIELDYIIDQFSKVKVRKMKPVIRTILRSSVYQLKYMDSVPDRVSESERICERRAPQYQQEPGGGKFPFRGGWSIQSLRPLFAPGMDDQTVAR